ncbi:hypothetical protein CJF42_12075 [Pseudoalteromonas sp. NBT06-2]|uniref:hypothetical protein n=1 Tax=Pseudoalteromonas sp. NBT06-2 TaxID=2025950 RepID=UPI000BA7D303|nr:hypothetical protein [Pseudoalteromonas sp. NBT06-2]PAJ74131.1 hypothetical protein CJF42_12075 [Pseudoalteromonas sp. NBT06-2]
MFQIDVELLNALFVSLNDKVKFLILRNHTGLPESNNAKDVDILVPKEVNPRVIYSLIRELADSLNAKIIWVNKLDYLSGFVLTRELGDGQVVYAKLDFFYGLKWRGLEFLNSDEILEQRESVANFYIPNQGHEAVIHIINGVLYGKGVNPKYSEIILHGYKHDNTQFEALLVKSGIGKLYEIIKSNVESLTSECLNIRKPLINLLIKNQLSANLVGGFLRSVKTEILGRRRFGYLLTFSGPDGAGKSSIMEPVISFFKLTGICKQELAHHFLPEGIPPLHRLLRFNKKLSKQDYTQPYSEKPVGLISSTVRLTYYLLAFFYAKNKYLKPQFKHNEVVIFDRYYPDLIADPTRARLSISRKIISPVLSLVAAKPDIAVIFVANPEILIKRKGELTEAKAVQLVKDYKGICENRDFTLLNNNGSLANGLSTCFSILFDGLHSINVKKLV